MKTYKYADMSTPHIQKSDADLLNRWMHEKGGPLVVYEKPEYGWFVYVPDSDDVDGAIEAMKAAGASDAFCNLIVCLSRGWKVTLLCLDRDGEEFALPKFEW